MKKKIPNKYGGRASRGVVSARLRPWQRKELERFSGDLDVNMSELHRHALNFFFYHHRGVLTNEMIDDLEYKTFQKYKLMRQKAKSLKSSLPR